MLIIGCLNEWTSDDIQSKSTCFGYEDAAKTIACDAWCVFNQSNEMKKAGPFWKYCNDNSGKILKTTMVTLLSIK